MNNYIVAIRETRASGIPYTLLLAQEQLAYLLLHIDEEKYEIGEIVPTHSETKGDIGIFCKVNDNLETGETKGD